MRKFRAKVEFFLVMEKKCAKKSESFDAENKFAKMFVHLQPKILSS